MHPVTAPRPAAGAGFTLLEAMIAMAILGLTMAVGIPSLNSWIQTNRAAGASEFYAEGFKLARAEALKHNGASRIRLTENAANGQMDWQVDICFPTAALACNAESGAWSTAAAAAATDPEGVTGFRSVVRSAVVLPDRSVMTQTRLPAGATDIYFTSLGWVDTAFAPRLQRIELTPAPGRAGAFPSAAVVVTLAGLPTKCDPTVDATDSRACPP